jgi:hypothetical protein
LAEWNWRNEFFSGDSHSDRLTRSHYTNPTCRPLNLLLKTTQFYSFMTKKILKNQSLL